MYNVLRDAGKAPLRRTISADPSTGPAVQAVVLAAGRGSRLADATSDRPKCLLDIGGHALIEHQLRLLSMAGVERVYVVVGYRGAQVMEAVGDRAAVICNPIWERSNSLYSLWLTRTWIDGPLLVMNGDVLAHPSILSRLLAAGASAFAYDSASGGEVEHMKVQLEDGVLRAMRKGMPATASHGENVGALYFDRAAAAQLFCECDAALAAEGPQAWAAAAVERLATRTPLRGVDVTDLPWIEIDFPHDLERARGLTWPNIAGIEPAATIAPRSAPPRFAPILATPAFDGAAE